MMTALAWCVTIAAATTAAILLQHREARRARRQTETRRALERAAFEHLLDDHRELDDLARGDL